MSAYFIAFLLLFFFCVSPGIIVYFELYIIERRQCGHLKGMVAALKGVYLCNKLVLVKLNSIGKYIYVIVFVRAHWMVISCVWNQFSSSFFFVKKIYVFAVSNAWKISFLIKWIKTFFVFSFLLTFFLCLVWYFQNIVSLVIFLIKFRKVN